ncbi:vWA domain-containing protein [Nonlabens ponticola]|uniref:VWA domain-containing protein n=1 Tax=Nonlabens ponticola TaxID=2496866 RepID=A0A3S9MV65_9FLAO|nr:VWA domain-containing protein [Nonlabens ponticola]AZQ43072.1 VWA domain-containing protein [Nonlabens ponticola]
MIQWWNRVEFLNPQWFWLLLIIPFLAAYYWWQGRQDNATVKISSLQGFESGTSWLARLRPLLYVLRLLAIALLIVAMARPQTTDTTTKVSTTEGIDIVLAIDVSASMLAKDLKPDRLEATKEVALDFIKGRPTDRIGVVVYAGESYTKTPITTDQSITVRAVEDIEYDNVLQNGTAIGMGLATAVNRLKESESESKVIILMTDGVNNSGFIDPKIASELAVEYGIKVYTIGIGTNGNAYSPVSIKADGSFRFALTPVEIDEQLMKEIASSTGGTYYRATNNKKLAQIYQEIDQLEKTEVEEFKFTDVQEKFRPLVLLALALLSMEMLLRYTLFRTAA